MIDNPKIINLLNSIDVAQTFSQGEPISITSKALYKDGISLSEQLAILNILANEYKYIRYKAEPIYKTVDDIPNELLLSYFEHQDLELDGKYELEDQVNDLLNEKIYTIAILDRFSTVLHKLDKPIPSPKPIRAERFMIKDLDVDNYNKKKGVLTLTPYIKIDFSNAGSIKRSNGKMYKQPELLGMLFNNVKSLKQGVSFSKILGVNDPIIINKQVKNIRNTMQEINGKITDIGGPDNLIIIQGRKVFVNRSYLL